MKAQLSWLSLALVAACQTGPDPIAADTAEIGVILAGAPAGIDCVSFKLDNEDGTSQAYSFSTSGPQTLRIRNVAVGAYDLSARAYGVPAAPPIADADCAAVPVNAPWATEAPVPVVVARGEITDVSVTLVPTGRIFITTTFLQAAEVIAKAQGGVGQVAANGDFVAFAVAASGGANGAVFGLDDAPGSAPVLLGGGQTNPGELAIDPASGTVFWENFPTGARDADGNRVADGSMWSSTGGQLAGGLNPSDIAVAASGAVYWGEIGTDSIDCAPCGAPLATGQVGANALTAHGNRVYWHNNNNGGVDAIYGMNLGDAAPQLLATITPRVAFGMAADDDFLYYIDYDPSIGLAHSNLMKLPAGGGAPLALVTDTLDAFPVVAFEGFVYFSDAAGIHRVDKNGGAVEDVVAQGAVSGFAVTTGADGHGRIYWSDQSHGGLIWRARLD
jgi:hypothetical protein